MGSESVKVITTRDSRQACMEQLLNDLEALEYLWKHQLFESDVQRIGVEQELCFVDEKWRPAMVEMEVLDKLEEENYTTEYAQFNMEINLDPQLFSGSCLSDMERQLMYFLEKGEKAANEVGAHLILTGILPSIRQTDLGHHSMTPLPRYKALTDMLAEMRGGPFEYRIEGTDQLIAKDDTALFESSNTSFQIHYQTPQHDFVDAYNWAQLITAPVLAAATNSPLFLGKRLWRETRIALFQQSVDTRNQVEMTRERSPRVFFGNDWVRESVTDIFKENLARHRLLLQSTKEENALEVAKSGKAPKLYALNVFNGTTYMWNRPCYGITDGKPHLRIENRVLPAGPSVVDEVANSAFWLGLMHGMPDAMRNLPGQLDFDTAKSNFLIAAQQGLGAHFRWPGIEGKIASWELILKELLPIAEKGLQKANIDPADIEKYLGVIKARVESGRTGSQWILDSFNQLKRDHAKDEAILATTAGLYRRQWEGHPVHTWDHAVVTEAGNWKNRYGTIGQIMTTDVFTVAEEDLIDFVAGIMNWRKIRHLPVENENGELVGMIHAKVLIEHYSSHCHHPERRSVSDIMERNVATVTPDTPTVDAIQLMREKRTACLPIIHEGKLMGVVTEHDFVKIASQLLRELEGPVD
jgi:CBS domain-containing protein